MGTNYTPTGRPFRRAHAVPLVAERSSQRLRLVLEYLHISRATWRSPGARQEIARTRILAWTRSSVQETNARPSAPKPDSWAG